jgi:hypothetical protein
MAFMMDRPRLPVMPPAPFGPDEYLLGRFRPKEILARLGRPPYRAAWQHIAQLARRSAGVDLRSNRMSESQRARFALALSLSWWLTGSPTHRRRAAEALDRAGVGSWSSWCSAPEAIIDYLLAADLLRPAHGGFGRRAEEHFIERIGEKVAGGVAVNAELPQNNWRLCTLSGIGMAALALWHRRTSWPVADWLEVALDGISRLLFGLVSPDGAYLEGPGYSRRASVSFLPFAWACTSRTRLDLINHPAVSRWMRWVAEAAMPDGANPPVDDTAREKLHPFALLCNRRCRDASLFRWAAGQSEWDSVWEAQALLLYDDSIRPRPPVDPASQILERSGIARFRSNWSPDATYGLLVARPYPPLGPGQSDSAHRHDDPTHFLVYANRELLALDAGYGGYSSPERYTWFLAGEAHNLILVDGLGPARCTYYKGDGREPNVSTSSGRVRKLFAGKDLVVALAETSYREVDFSRLVAFVRGSYFVVLDVVDSAAAHTYSWVLHGAGRLMHLDAHRALWQASRSRLDVRWVYPSGLAVTRHTGVHCENHAEARQHEYVKASVTGKRVLFLTVLLPCSGRERPARVEPLSVTEPALGVSIRRGDAAEHFAFDPWGSGATLRLPAGRGERLTGAWVAFLKGPRGLRCYTRRTNG